MGWTEEIDVPMWDQVYDLTTSSPVFEWEDVVRRGLQAALRPIRGDKLSGFPEYTVMGTKWEECATCSSPAELLFSFDTHGVMVRHFDASVHNYTSPLGWVHHHRCTADATHMWTRAVYAAFEKEVAPPRRKGM
jgi:hypothetical protein